MCFEAVSGLKLNFFQSKLIGVGVDEQSILMLVDIMGCKVGSLPATYLGLLLCLGGPSKALLNLVVESGMQACALESKVSFNVGKVTLIQVVLSNPLVYFMSLF